MTSSPPVAISPTDHKDEIIFPQGEFWSDEPPLETNLHLRQILILIQCLEWAWQNKDDYFATGNLTVYYSPNQKKSEDFRGPDFFVVLGTTRNQERRSWVVWQEGGKYPNVIIEILSDSTAKIDRGEKKEIYQDVFRTPDYFWFDPDSLEFQGFTLIRGTYEPITPNEQGWLWSQQLGLYLGIHQRQLRYFTSDGELVLSPEEAATQAQQQLEQERQRAEQERQRAEQERQRAEQLEARLRSLGIDPNES
ncbi:Uma2 family endonuclease [Fortiea contorta]|uniref:Uma2 family endonuclease n=1 Tax=Fortiea contorta TaxID=1892405 RepID=UPI000360B5D9|nr:Uma2 family endonuclease [Fortiea contorta]